MNHCSRKLPGIREDKHISNIQHRWRKLLGSPCTGRQDSVTEHVHRSVCPAWGIYGVSVVSPYENKDFYSTFLPLLPPTPPSLSPSLPLSLSEGERGRLHRAWQQCSVECELEMWNKDVQHPWKRRARPHEGACLFSVDARVAATVCWDLPHLHFEVLLPKRLRFY